MDDGVGYGIGQRGHQSATVANTHFVTGGKHGEQRVSVDIAGAASNEKSHRGSFQPEAARRKRRHA
jgi:hypothetical protein